jgi:subtilase family serine protease
MTRRATSLVATAVLLSSALVVGVIGTAAQGAPGASANVETRPVCGPVAGPFARCHAIQVLNPAALARTEAKGGHRPPTSSTTTTSTTTSGTTTTTTTVPSGGSCTAAHAGYTPCDLQAAYKLPFASAGGGQTVAIVDAYDDPNAEADLGVYRATYGLTPCTTANGCFRKVDQNGGTSYPAGNTGWSEEISLDLDMVSAVCENCHILLVEAASNGLGDLLTAEQTAGSLGASAISNSWGANEFLFEILYDSYFQQGVAITASAGDSGYGTIWPAASPYVIAVGGTSLVPDGSSRGWSETAWKGTGSGCSPYESKPAWQHDSGCGDRTVGDVAAVADPATGVAVYDTYNESGWLAFGGTSVSAPIVAAVYALAGNGKSANAPSDPYANPSALFDVTSGSNGTCSPAYLCTAGVGYDGPTGLGTPNGTGAF